MDHVYVRTFCLDNGNQLELPANVVSGCFDIGFPPAGYITRLIVKQSGGTSSDFTVNLYDRQACSLVVDESESLSDAQAGCPAELASIVPSEHTPAGGTCKIEDTGGYAYRNREGSFSVPVRKVYLEITLDEAVGDITSWDVSLCCIPHI